MKKTLFLLLPLLLCVTLSAQNRENTYIIKFSDKSGSQYSLSNPSLYLSNRAIERRLIQEIPLNETDIPINPSYIQQVKDLGANVIYSSKWLNLVMTEVNDETLISKIEELPFVKAVNQSSALKKKKNNQLFKHFFLQERYQKVDPNKYTNFKKSTIGFNYGPSGNQAQMLKVDELHRQGYTGNGIVIAVIDAGFNSADIMDAFDSLFINNKILGTRDFVEPGNNVYNSTISTHGTMVLSTMGGNLPGQLVGTAPHASYYLLRSEDATAEYLMEEYFWIQAAEYADSLGVDLINTSLGYSTFDNPDESHSYSDLDGNTTPITIGADLAASKGILVVNSAGNEGANEWHYISAPADGDSVLTVGAVDAEGNYVWFSSVGPTADGRIKPDVVAQGYAAIVAQIPSGIATASGTSFSSPIFCGAAACLWQANPLKTNMEIYEAVKQSGNNSSILDNNTGWGIPDFVHANSLLVGNIELVNYSSEIKCYPNPFDDFVFAELLTDPNSDMELALLNVHGTVLKKFTGSDLSKGNNRFKFNNLELLPKGIYFIRVHNGNESFIQKIIK